ncbi:MAG: hypothetical protein EG825_09435 [Rhodocyclaceae bacterium]|nr:hypothetical protein [Rhodocyclaceae bacterium]
MTYEEFLDEVTTLIVEKYDLEDHEAIQLVMRAQAAEYFVRHDDDPKLRTLERAHQEARAIYKRRAEFPK